MVTKTYLLAYLWDSSDSSYINDSSYSSDSSVRSDSSDLKTLSLFFCLYFFYFFGLEKNMHDLPTYLPTYLCAK